VGLQTNRLPLVLVLILCGVCFTTPQRSVFVSAQEEKNIASPTPEVSALSSIINQLVVIHRRMRAANERLERFTERLDFCLTRSEEEGKNTFIAEQFLNQAKVQLRNVEGEVLELDVVISSAAYSTPPYTELSQAIIQVKETKSSLTDCLETIKKTVREARHAHETI
jgi:hypothetical protein